MDYQASQNRFARKSGTLLVVKLDAIGDYILFRNFLAVIKQSDLFGGYRITLCGNEAWKDFAEKIDSLFVDDFIWIDRKRFYSNLDYRSDILKEINRKGFEVVLQSSYSREYFYCDAVVKASRAKESIGQAGDTRNITRKAKFFSNMYYSKLIRLSGREIFEFYRNRGFFGGVLGKEIDIKTPALDISTVFSKYEPGTPYAIIFPGAGEKFRRWPANKFADIADFITDKYDLRIVIAGSGEDSDLAKEIISSSKTLRITDLTGKTPLPELAKLIAMSSLLVSNETGAVHMAVAVATRVVCISNGNHFGRFHPYPGEMAAKASFVYPPTITEHLDNPMKLYSEYGNGSSIDIETISISQVKQAIESLLSEKN